MRLATATDTKAALTVTWGEAWYLPLPAFRSLGILVQ